MKIHLDTDLGGDIDDLQALAWLLASPEVELTGITTAAEDSGRRAGYARRALEIAGRLEVPVAAGIDVRGGRFRQVPTYPDDVAYWSEPVPRVPGPAADAFQLLLESVEAGATVLCIGPFTNVAAFDQLHPGRLADARLVLMGTTIVPPKADLPQWGVDMDYNVQQDVAAAQRILECSSPMLVPLGVTMQASIRRSHLRHLAAGNALARLVARQAEAFDSEWRNAERYRSMPGVPADMINCLYDPVAAMIAAGWRSDVDVQTLPVAWEVREGYLAQYVSDEGKPLPVVTGLDGVAAEQAWLRRVSGAGTSGTQP